MRRGLDDGTERLRGQFRDASQRGQRDRCDSDQIEDSAWAGTRWGTRSIEKLLKTKKSDKSRIEPDSHLGTDAPDGGSPLEVPASAESALTSPPTSSGRTDHVRIKTRETVSERLEVHPSASRRRGPLTMTREVSGASKQSRVDTPQIKTREAVQQRTAHTFGDTVPLDAERQVVGGPSPQTVASKGQAVFQRDRSRMLRRPERPPLPQAKETARTPSVGHVDHIESSFHSGLDIKTKDSYMLRLDSPERPSKVPDLGSRMKAWYMQRRRPAKKSPQALDQEIGRAHV